MDAHYHQRFALDSRRSVMVADAVDAGRRRSLRRQAPDTLILHRVCDGEKGRLPRTIHRSFPVSEGVWDCSLVLFDGNLSTWPSWSSLTVWFCFDPSRAPVICQIPGR